MKQTLKFSDEKSKTFWIIETDDKIFKVTAEKEKEHPIVDTLFAVYHLSF